jgi:hypothetical protein
MLTARSVAAKTVTSVGDEQHDHDRHGRHDRTTTDYVSIAGSVPRLTARPRDERPCATSWHRDLGGITVSSYPVWQSHVDSTAQALTLALMYTQNRKVHQKTGKPSDYVLTSLDQQEAFYKLVQAQVRFAGDQGLGAGNVDGVSVQRHDRLRAAGLPEGRHVLPDDRRPA